MTLPGSTLCNIIQTFPVLLILAQKNNKCLKTPLIYKPPSPTHSPEYYEAYDALIQSLLGHDCDYSYPHYGNNDYGYGKKWAQDYTYYKPCNGHHPMLPHGYSYPSESHGVAHNGYPHGLSHGVTHNGYPHGVTHNGYPYGSKKANMYNSTYVYQYAPNQMTNTKHKYKFVVLKNGRGRIRAEKLREESCKTVDSGVGSCVPVKLCEPYVKLIQQARSSPVALKTLRGAHCGFDGNNPKVCCPRSGIPDVRPPPPGPVTSPPHTTAAVKVVRGEFLDRLPEPPICGVSNASFSRVVGGINAKLGDFLWMALLGYLKKKDDSTRWLCGGSLISSRHVLTAAHCIHNHEEDLYVVRLGELDLARDDDGATPVDVLIKQKTKHELYNPKSFTNDIGILLLEKDVEFTDLIRPICIPKEPELRARSFENYNPIIAGWGDTEFRGPSATHLQVLQLPVVGNDACASAYSQYKAQVIDKRVLCAGYKNGGKDACQGDSGGPLMQPIWNSVTYETFFYQIGVVSFGKKCAEAGFPGVYTRVTEFVPWIQKIVLGV